MKTSERWGDWSVLSTVRVCVWRLVVIVREVKSNLTPFLAGAQTSRAIAHAAASTVPTPLRPLAFGQHGLLLEIETPSSRTSAALHSAMAFADDARRVGDHARLQFHILFRLHFHGSKGAQPYSSHEVETFVGRPHGMLLPTWRRPCAGNVHHSDALRCEERGGDTG